MGKIIRYGHDGMKVLIRDHADKADLARIACRRAAQGWGVSWLSPVRFEITMDAVAAGAVYVLRPHDWPSRDGEPQ